MSTVDTALFESERARLTAVAARILGGTAEADDVVQEAWLRLARTDHVDDPPAWLTTVVTRLCLDHLRRRQTRSAAEGHTPAGPPDGADPEVDALLADRVGGALQVVLDALAPAERAAFVLHDVFAYPFDEVGEMLGRSPAAARKLASRARLRLRGAPDADDPAVRAGNRRVVEAFLAAARGGELGALLDLLAPDAVMRADRVGQRIGADALYDGAEAVAGRFRGGARGARLVSVDGEPGLAWVVGGDVKVAFAFHLDGGLVREIELLADPEVLATLSIVPAGAAERGDA
ncbi:RNA polymerase, sigma-24 subunit, ECF subfamily [Cellulomonas fimi ATCC 484]|uniref:RNA polymerase, sigma-24 subunit, ECF subfamily n=1 Tax=Cellulomonas fimi (strain ATCC 484 / DSM 20113 / JCM 1341 / CCUG 24087 / LMG 16345 / NBRC 15513 / NCIMB 8980 / NCTC 7547 / NRS-133) TaxID=590998 RepID=F4GY39_CELFA|nr:RNA polymerase, sigma-24 subunit, ECF subfamily [Cellulomonas fimi ATCC 484]VEH27066.1 Probable RNA polymerase sigma factor fecI [Cellulomonas fimi]